MNKTLLPPIDHARAPQTALQLRDRYFRAETSPAEEEWLLRFVLSPQGSGPEWDGLRAVLTFTAMGRLQSQAASPAQSAPQRPAPRHLRTVRRVAAVMAVALLGATAWWMTSRPAEEPSDVCVAYVGGRQITDRAEVMALMHESMADMGTVETDELLRNDLGDMLSVPAE